MTGGGHTERCPRSPNHDEILAYWIDWHLTEAGWVQGERQQGTRHDGAGDRVQNVDVFLTVQVGASVRNGEPVGDTSSDEKYRRSDKSDRIEQLLAKHPIPTRYMT